MRHPAAETAKQSIRDCFPGYGHSVRKMAFFCLGRRKTKDFSACGVYQGNVCDGVLAFGVWRGGDFGEGVLMVLCKVWLVVGEGKMWYDGE